MKILIDPKALMHVIGTKMDFVDDKLRLIFSSFFLFISYDLFWWKGVNISACLACKKLFA